MSQLRTYVPISRPVSAILVENESEPSPAKVIDLVAQHGITAYDGQFIALAMEMGVPLVTQDRGLQGKFPRVAVSMDDFLKPPIIRGIGEERTGYRTRARRRRLYVGEGYFSEGETKPRSKGTVIDR